MCAACQTGYQEIRSLFNHANMRTDSINTISNFLIAYVRFAFGNKKASLFSIIGPKSFM